MAIVIITAAKEKFREISIKSGRNPHKEEVKQAQDFQPGGHWLCSV